MAQDALQYSQLLTKARQMAGEKRRVTRSQAQQLTKEFDPKYNDNSNLVELNDMLSKLFKEWGSIETNDVPYLNLLIMWIDTRDFRRVDVEETPPPPGQRDRRASFQKGGASALYHAASI